MSDSNVPPNQEPADGTPPPSPWQAPGQDAGQPTGEQQQVAPADQQPQHQWGQQPAANPPAQHQWGQQPAANPPAQPGWGQQPPAATPSAQQPQWGQQPTGQQEPAAQQPQWGQQQPSAPQQWSPTGQQPPAQQWNQPGPQQAPGQQQWNQTGQQPADQQWNQTGQQPTGQWAGAAPAAAPSNEWSYGSAAPQQPQSFAGAQPPEPPKRKNRLPLLLGIGGGAVVVIAIIVVAALVLPGILAPKAKFSALVDDLPSEPKAAWKADYRLGNDSDQISDVKVAMAGDDVAVVVPEFNEKSWKGGDSKWYPGYDEDYEKGYTAGTQYKAARDKWLSDLSAPYPDRKKYWPGESDYTDYSAPDYRGVSDGFYDGWLGLGKGRSQAEKPEDPDYTPYVAAVNLSNGKQLWKLNVEKTFTGADFLTPVVATPVDGTGTVLLTAAVSDAKTSDVTTTVVAVDATSGKVGAKHEFDGTASVQSHAGATYVLSKEDADSPVEVARYAGAGIDKKPVWSNKVDEKSQYLSFIGDDVMVTGFSYRAKDSTSDSSDSSDSSDDSDDVSYDVVGEVFVAADGKNAKWGDDIDAKTSYYELGDRVLRAEADSDGKRYELMAIDPASGKDVWADSVNEDQFWSVDGTLIVADRDGDSDYDGAQILDPATGKEKWSDGSYDDKFNYVDAVIGDKVLLQSADEVAVLGLGDGKEVYTERFDKDSSVFIGTSQFYVAEEDGLSAHKYSERDETWSYDLDSTEHVIRVGAKLFVVDTDRGTASLLAS